jgi:acyl-CoA thioesterase-2
MHPAVERLCAVLELERLDDSSFQGRSTDEMGQHLFGGQVLAQGLAAANHVAEGVLAHSLHAYFLRRGTPQQPIRFEVVELRRSRAFRTCQVTASQPQGPILQMGVSYHRPEQGPEHQIPMDAVGPPQGEAYERALMRAMTPRIQPGDDTPFELPVEIRGVGGLALFSSEVRPPKALCWMRMRGEVPADPALHQCLFAYASDYAIFAPVVHPHPHPITAFQSASLDHAIWFHRPFRMDEWVLFELDSPAAVAARGVGRGLLYTRDGELVASCVQEGLLRPLRDSG